MACRLYCFDCGWKAELPRGAARTQALLHNPDHDVMYRTRTGSWYLCKDGSLFTMHVKPSPIERKEQSIYGDVKHIKFYVDQAYGQ